MGVVMAVLRKIGVWLGLSVICLGSGADLVEAKEAHSTLPPLFRAIVEDDIKAFQAALRGVSEESLNRNLPELEGETPLITAARLNRKEMLTELLKRPNVCVDCYDNERFTALTEAAIRGWDRLVEPLVRAGADINHRSRGGLTPLMMAAIYRHLDVLRELITHQADVNLADDDGETALHLTISSVDIPKAEDLVELIPHDELREMLEGVDLEKIHGEILAKLSEEIEEKVEAKFVAWLKAQYERRLQMMSLLLGANADVNRLCREEKTPLGASLELKDDRAFRMLLSAGGNLDLVTDEHGSSALYVAINFRKYDLARFFVTELQMDVNEANDVGLTALHIASLQSDDLDFLEFLVEEGAKINRKASLGSTPLILASTYGYVEAVEKLLELGAEIEEQNSVGMSALLAASFHSGCKETVECLINAGANLRARDEDGDTSLHLAMYSAIATGQLDAAKLIFMKKPGLANTQNHQGSRPDQLIRGTNLYQEWTEFVDRRFPMRNRI